MLTTTKTTIKLLATDVLNICFGSKKICAQNLFRSIILTAAVAAVVVDIVVAIVVDIVVDIVVVVVAVVAAVATQLL